MFFMSHKNKWLKKAEECSTAACKFGRVLEYMELLGIADYPPAGTVRNHIEYLTKKARYYMSRAQC